MGLDVSQLTRNYLNKRNVPEPSDDTIPFEVELTEHQRAKLKFLAGRLEASEATVVNNLLDAAMEDALKILGAFDTMSYEDTQTIPMDEQLEIVDRQVESYRDEIQHISDEGVA